MITVLIIEDNLEKLRLVTTFLNKVCNIADSNITYVEYIKAGRELLMQNQYDLLLLDLVLPVNEGDDPSAETGSNFLEEIHYNPNINIPIHIIGLTEFDRAFKDYYEDFEDKLWGLINFNIQNNDWIDKLSSKIFYLQNYKNKYEKYIQEKNKFDVVIITALNIEFEQLLKTSTWNRVSIENDNLVYYSTTVNTKNNNIQRIVCCCINQMGMQAAAAVASKAIAKFSPNMIFMSGICAGIKSNGVSLGDIVVATHCWDYESGKISEGASGELFFHPEIKVLPTDQGSLSRLTDFTNNRKLMFNIYNEFDGTKPDTQLKVFYGPIGSGPYVLSNKAYLDNLLSKDRKLVAIDMEGFGIYKAAQFHSNVLPILIKSVSDYGDDKKGDNYQNFAAYVSGKFIIDFIYNYY